MMNAEEYKSQIARAQAVRSRTKNSSPAALLQFELDFAEPIPAFDPASETVPSCAAFGAQRAAEASVVVQGAGIAPGAPTGRKRPGSVPVAHRVRGVSSGQGGA
jgi:hypothetical protein